MTVLSSKGTKAISSRVSLNHAKQKAISAKPKPAYKSSGKPRGSLEGLIRKRDAVLEHSGTGYSSPANQKARFRSNRLNTNVNYGKMNGGHNQDLMHHTDITMRPRRNR
jgi:hypothetical protein